MDKLTEEELQAATQSLSHKLFAKPFLGHVRWNSRLRTSAGRYSHRDKCIELNPKYMEYYGHKALIDTIKHELIHYHYPTAGHGPIFGREAARIGCGRFCSPLPSNAPPHIYKCQHCGKEYHRHKRVNLSRYRCGICKGKLDKRD